MKTIGYKTLAKLLRASNTIMGAFPEKRSSWDKAGYELTFLETTTLRVKGKRVGEHSEYHVIKFPRGGFDNNPAHFGYWSYGEADAVKVLLLEEIKKAKKSNETPQLDCGPTHYTSENVQVQATIPNTATTKTVYTMYFRMADMYLTTWGNLETARHDRTWATKQEGEHYRSDCTVTLYTFDTDHDSKEQSKAA